MKKEFYYHLPTEIYFGEGQIKRLSRIAGKRHRVMLVCGRGFLRKSGWLQKIKTLLKGNKVLIFDGVYENPDVELVETGLSLARKNRIDLVIGVGGGSVLDCAKAIAALVPNKGQVITFLEKKRTLTRPGLRFIAVPTTAGSASEVTPYSVITVPQRGIKVTLAHKYLYPEVAVIDPVFLKSLSRSQIANPGIDVLCHAIESYWSVSNNPISDAFAIEAVKLVFENLKGFYRNRHSKLFRINMARASLFAGLAFSNTRTTACHSISYPLTTIYRIPHGQACAVTLPEVLIYNEKALKVKMESLKNIVGAEDVAKVAHQIRNLILDIGLKIRLRDLNLKESDLLTVLAKGFTPERMANNPRKISRGAMRAILKKVY